MRPQLPQPPRNFRKAYYETLGVKVGSAHDIQASFSQLLEEDVVNISYLIKLALQFGVPSSYRPIVWKLILNLLPSQRDKWEATQRRLDESFELVERVCLLLDLTDRTQEVSNSEDIRVAFTHGRSSYPLVNDLVPATDILNDTDVQDTLLFSIGGDLRWSTTSVEELGPVVPEIDGLPWDQRSLPLDRLYTVYQEINVNAKRKGAASDLGLLKIVARTVSNIFDKRSDAFWILRACVDLLSYEVLTPPVVTALAALKPGVDTKQPILIDSEPSHGEIRALDYYKGFRSDAAVTSPASTEGGAEKIDDLRQNNLKQHTVVSIDVEELETILCRLVLSLSNQQTHSESVYH